MEDEANSITIRSRKDAPSANFVSIPNEVVLHIFRYLPRLEGGLVRQTCKQLATIGAKAYFETVTTSFQHIDRLLLLANHEELSQHIQRLDFREVDMDIQKKIDDASNEDLFPEFRRLIETVVGAHDYPDPWYPDPWYPDPESSEEPHPELPPDVTYADFPQGQMKKDIVKDLARELIRGCFEEYESQHAYQKSTGMYRLLKIAIQGLPNLKRLKFSNARIDGIGVTSSFLPTSLRHLQQYVPIISEGFFYALFKRTASPSAQGLLQILGAFHELDRKIDELEVQNNDGLFAYGVSGLPMLSIDKLPEHLQEKVIPAFKELKRLDLTACLGNWGAGDLGNHDVSDAKPPLSNNLLHKVLTAAVNVESLSLHFESGSLNDMNYADILPVAQKYRRLHTLRLDAVPIQQPDGFTNFLLHGLPALHHLSLNRCELQGEWGSVFEKLSIAPYFTLKSVNLSEPIDRSVPTDQDLLQEQSHHNSPNDTLCASKIPNDKLLHFINNHGSPNPFAARKWRFFDRWIQQRALDANVRVGEGDEDFDNMSDWLPFDDPAEDLDGPEYDSEYDFDAESDSEEEDKWSDEDLELLPSI